MGTPYKYVYTMYKCVYDVHKSCTVCKVVFFKLYIFILKKSRNVTFNVPTKTIILSTNYKIPTRLLQVEKLITENN